LSAPHGVYYDPYRGSLTHLSQKPSFKSPRGRFLRWMLMRRLPAMRRMHEREIAERSGARAQRPSRVVPTGSVTSMIDKTPIHSVNERALLDDRRPAVDIEELEALAKLAAHAPSGDNLQPWHIAVDGPHRAVVVDVDGARDPSPMNAG